MKVPATAENISQCVCYAGDCPTYEHNHLRGRIFCSTGKSDITPEKWGCICMNCPVWLQYNLKRFHYCVHGAAEE